jgi:hypothetical protein
MNCRRCDAFIRDFWDTCPACGTSTRSFTIGSDFVREATADKPLTISQLTGSLPPAEDVSVWRNPKLTDDMVMKAMGDEIALLSEQGRALLRGVDPVNWPGSLWAAIERRMQALCDATSEPSL